MCAFQDSGEERAQVRPAVPARELLVTAMHKRPVFEAMLGWSQ